MKTNRLFVGSAMAMAVMAASLVGCSAASDKSASGAGGASSAADGTTGAGKTTATGSSTKSVTGAGSGGGSATDAATGAGTSTASDGTTVAAGPNGTTGSDGTTVSSGTTGSDATGSGGATAGTASAGTSAGGNTSAPSMGCGVTGSPTGTAQDMMLTVSGQTTVRTYRLSVPTDYSAATPLPLIIGFHGVGGNGKGTQSSFGLESAKSGAGKAIFAYPDALTKVEPDGTTAIDWDTTSAGVDFAFFDALVKELETKYCVDTSRIFATGISAGGIFTNFMGCWRGDVLRAIAPVASMKPWSTPKNGATKCNGEVAAMVIHGTNDPYSDYTTDGLGARDFWIQQNACQPTTPPPVADPTTPNACLDYQGCNAGYPVVMCSHDEGHAWPVKTGYSCSATSMVCFDASIAVWNFFSTLP